MAVVGKIISIFDISIEVILSNSNVKIGEILQVKDNDEYVFGLFLLIILVQLVYRLVVITALERVVRLLGYQKVF